MTERQQPDLSTDAGTSYQRTVSNKRRAPSAGGAGRTVGMNVFVVLLLAGLALAGWFIWNQQQMLAAEQIRVTDATGRLEKLEQRLMATDSALSQEGQDTQEKIGLWETEIRKLWSISNDRNKKWIKTNEQGVAKLNKTVNGIAVLNRDLQASVGRHESAFTQQQTMIDQLTSLELQMQQIVRGQRDLVDKVNAATQSVASMKASLSGQVDDNSEAIQSIDAYRVALNSRLGDLERRLNAMTVTMNAMAVTMNAMTVTTGG